MGGNQSTPSSSSSSPPSSNPNSTTATSMPSSNSPASNELRPQSEPASEQKHQVSDSGAQGSSDPSSPPENSVIKEDGSIAEGEADKEGEAGEEDEEVGECGFCIYMKGGGCANEFIEWEKCVEEGDRNNEDIAEKCFQLTSALRKCMEAHSDYYAPLLDAEKAAHEMANKEIEEEKEKEAKEKDGVTQVEESATAAEVSAKG